MSYWFGSGKAAVVANEQALDNSSRKSNITHVVIVLPKVAPLVREVSQKDLVSLARFEAFVHELPEMKGEIIKSLAYDTDIFKAPNHQLGIEDEADFQLALDELAHVVWHSARSARSKPKIVAWTVHVTCEKLTI